MKQATFVLCALLALGAAAFLGYGIGVCRGQRQHYALGHAIFVDHASPPNRQFVLTGKMDVVAGDAFVQVVTRDGTYEIPRERFVFAGPDTALADVVGKADPPATEDSASALTEYYRRARDSDNPATMYYMGSSGTYAYYFMARPWPHSGGVIKVSPGSDALGGPVMGFTTDVDNWRRIDP